MKNATRSDYVSYRELFAMIQESRRKLGLPEYKHRSSLGYALIHNRIPSVKVNSREKHWHAPTALRVLCPGAGDAAATMPEPGEVWATLGEVHRHANELRVRLGLRPHKRAESCILTLKRKGVPRRRYGNRNYYYHLPSALQALTRCENPGNQQPLHRLGTAEELESGEFMPLTECARMLRCASSRLTSAASKYYILAFRHPHTNRIWVSVYDAERIAYYRTASFLFLHLSVDEVHYLMNTRPHIDRCWDGTIVRRYYVPELSHIGSETTKLRQK